MDFRTQVDKGGKILLPIELRKEMSLKKGDTIVLRKIDKEVKLLKFHDIVNELHTIFANNKKLDVSMTDEVLKMRKREQELE